MLTNICKRTFSTAGSLLTWGQTTYGWGRPISQNLRNPQFVPGFNDVTQVSTGQLHMALLTSKSRIYTVGYGEHGRLGHGNQTTLEAPKLVQNLGNATFKQVACGQRHTLALSDNGDVYSWGYGGSCNIFGLGQWLSDYSPLGLGINKHQYTPVKVELLSTRIKNITAGKDFSMALGQDGKLYGWGKLSRYFGVPNSSVPQQMQQVSYLTHKKHSNIKKIAACNTFTFILLQNGKLFVMGMNNEGVLAARENPLIMTDKLVYEPTKVSDHYFHGEKILDFAIASNSLIVLTQKNKVLYSGMQAKYRLQPFPMQTKPKSIFATQNSVGVIDINNKVYFVNDQIVDSADKNDNVFVNEDKNLQGNILGIGGNYLMRYAIVQK